jgi:hypothetical protein
MSTTGGRQRRNCRTKNYRDLLKKIPESIKVLAKQAFAVFLRNPRDPSLHNHELEDSGKGRHRNGSRAVYINLRYRAIYVEDGDVNVWYWVGSHEDYNDFTGGK